MSLSRLLLEPCSSLFHTKHTVSELLIYSEEKPPASLASAHWLLHISYVKTTQGVKPLLTRLNYQISHWKKPSGNSLSNNLIIVIQKIL